MDPASLALSVVSVAETTLRLCRKLRELVEAYRNAESKAEEYSIEITHYVEKSEAQIRFLVDVWNSLDEPLRASQSTLLQKYQATLQQAIFQIDPMRGKLRSEALNPVSRARTVMNRVSFMAAESKLKRIIDDLKHWEQLFDPSWFLIGLVSTRVIDQQLSIRNTQTAETSENAISTKVTDSMLNLRLMLAAGRSQQLLAIPKGFIKPAEFLSPKTRNIAYSKALISSLMFKNQDVIVDTRTYDKDVDLGETRQDVQSLAWALHHVDPKTFGLLKCLGVVANDEVHEATLSYKFLFEIPPECSAPRGLRAILLDSKSAYPLGERVQLARAMAKSVAFIHNIGFVHKKISPDSFIVFAERSTSLGVPFLTGFEKFRSTTAHSTKVGDLDWESNLYRHRKRQGIQPEETYSMQHDIYSLGVCLLEIGLWESFLQYAPDTGHIQPHEMFRSMLEETTTNLRVRAALTQSFLVHLASEMLPLKLGTRYSNVVLSCLTCLETEDNSFGESSEFVDSDGVLVGLRYIEKILVQLEEICL